MVDFFLLNVEVRMALNIENPEADGLARQLAQATGESLTEAVLTALRERLVRETGRKDEHRLKEIRRIVEEYRRLPLLDDRGADEILGYDEHGLPS